MSASCSPNVRTPEDRRREAIKTYGITESPYAVGFVLAGCGSWLDFGEGRVGPRSQDHRHIAHLLAEEECVSEEHQAARSINMGRWMDLAHAVRVSVAVDTSRTMLRWYPPACTVILHLPEDREALLACLAPTVRASIQRLARRPSYIEVVEYLGGDETVHTIEHPDGFPAVMDLFDRIQEAVRAEITEDASEDGDAYP